MMIDGRALADSILQKLSEEVIALKKGGVTPALAVILVGDDPASLAYIRQKQRAGEKIGAKVIFEHFPDTVGPELLEATIDKYNKDSSVYGLIVQRPVPTFIGRGGDILNTVSPGKDVDGFVPHSPFEVPVAEAVVVILEEVHRQLNSAGLVKTGFKIWLNSQMVAVVGRGETAGKPIASTLAKYNCATSVIHSKTANPEKIMESATVIISCVGKEHIITKKNIHPGVILISVGLCRGDDGKLHGDYDDDSVSGIASFYTPTPGGVGPVNVACLMRNLVDATVMAQK